MLNRPYQMMGSPFTVAHANQAVPKSLLLSMSIKQATKLQQHQQQWNISCCTGNGQRQLFLQGHQDCCYW